MPQESGTNQERLQAAVEHAGDLARALQHALLPSEPPSTPFAAVAGAYRPAETTANVGGDWYDVFPLSAERLMISIGDVTGHGLTAAEVMAQVRHALRAYAFEGHAPADMLTSINRFACGTREDVQCTAWLGIFDPSTRELVYAGAGHPPAVVLTADRVEFLPSEAPLLGVWPDVAFPQRAIRLPSGSRLIAYTDGLIETAQDLAAGERRLVAVAQSTRTMPPDRAIHALVEGLVNGLRLRDDVAVLIVDVLPDEAPVSASLRALPRSLARCRGIVRAFARRVGVPDERIEEVVAAVGEAVLNTVQHAYHGAHTGDVTVRGRRRGDAVTVTVADAGRWRAPGGEPRGWGTRLMRRLADRVQIRACPDGTTVELSWFVRRRAPQEEGRRRTA